MGVHCLAYALLVGYASDSIVSRRNFERFVSCYGTNLCVIISAVRDGLLMLQRMRTGNGRGCC